MFSQDLRIWTIFRAEVAHFKTQHVSYRKTGPEWEILADLGLRLRHKEEAKEAYQKCLDQKFSARAWLKLLEMYSEEGDLSRSLNAIIRLSAHRQRYANVPHFPCELIFTSVPLQVVRGMCGKYHLLLETIYILLNFTCFLSVPLCNRETSLQTCASPRFRENKEHCVEYGHATTYHQRRPFLFELRDNV